jgi:hypothetical protein
VSPETFGELVADGYLNFYTDHYGARNGIGFTPPTVIAGWDTGEFLTTLFSRGERGVTVMLKDGVATEKRFVTSTQLADSDFYFLGGHEYSDISEEAGEALADAGYEVVVTEIYP